MAPSTTHETGLLVSPENVAAFARDGAVCVRELLDQQQVERFTALFETLIARGQDMSSYYGDGLPGKTVVQINAWRADPAFVAAVKESPLPRAAAELFGSTSIRLYEDLLIHKAPGTEQATPWHQDEPQWPVSGRKMASGWFCLDPVTAETGTLRFVAGSHNGPMYRPYVPPERQPDVEADARYFEGGTLPDIEAEPGKHHVISFEVQPGDVVFFHPRMLHGAYGCAPPSSRRTLSIRFLGDDIRWLPKKSVFYESLGEVDLREGDPIAGDSFPLLWNRSVA